MPFLKMEKLMMGEEKLAKQPEVPALGDPDSHGPNVEAGPA